ncbi:TIGR03067 domain-containing protein [Frateuria sp. STR12]|uniref:TIGR03067 domain-containing protein n=1 Tax=Frateuria hangzhouensis TaxID=2995589 RepID=UPI002260FF1F|nr:TIGR03067 domain-containing protein [Frateuria sp. STR12]MCX7512687.1 TIGR03067 domain-containing protein [Frateuria sp. STR12]
MDTTGSNARDLDALQGTWEQIAFEENGIVDAPDSSGAPGALTTIRGDRFAVHTRAGELLLKGRFLLDAATMPRSITWIDAIGPDAGRQLPASYRLDGDRFVFIAADEGMPRPVEFRTVPGLTMRAFVRWHGRNRATDTAGR